MNDYIVLLGDSIFDNASYAGPGGKPVIDYLNEYTPRQCKAVLLARDGAVMRDVLLQADKIPSESKDIILSIGGNNIRQYLSILEEPAATVSQVLNRFYEIKMSFEEEYLNLLKKLKEKERPLTVCTIYNCFFENEEKQKAVETAVALFDDAIIRSACRLSVPYIELRDVCSEASDYVNRIEPSDSGGRKIAERIASGLTQII